MQGHQLPLLIPSDPAYDAAEFLPDGSNEAARTWLGRTEVWPDRRLALWGGADRGKTHLLHIWATSTEAEIMDGHALDGVPVIASPSGVAIDHADRADEHALLHLLNTARDLGRPVLLAGRGPPARWPVTLSDLASRLRAITAVEVGLPDDDLLRRLLLRWLAERRLVADEALHDRLLTYLPRSPDILRAAVLRLDRDALVSRRRKVTPGMLRAALSGEPADDNSEKLTPPPPG
ncbi:MAG: chromosomal replication initiator DnaA [Acetobacteraceae bacterium]|nr:chromosomal replication initiator DnaA [Acetobacteraceae bacterium]